MLLAGLRLPNYDMIMIAFTPEQAEGLLQRVVSAFNASVRSGDFSAFVDLFADDAVLEFEGINDYGPYTGHAAIAAKFATNPPDDQIRVTRWKTHGAQIVAEFKWLDIPEAIGGCLIITPGGERIEHITVAFGGPHCAFRLD